MELDEKDLPAHAKKNDNAERGTRSNSNNQFENFQIDY